MGLCMLACVVNDCDEHVHVLLQLQEISITQSICHAQGSDHLHNAGLYMHMYICMYACTYIITSYVCTYIYMYVCMYVCTHTHLDAYNYE